MKGSLHYIHKNCSTEKNGNIQAMRVGVKTPNKSRKPLKESMKCISRRFVDYLACNDAINENNAVATSCYAIKSDF